jgi:hypothetical protein
MEIKNKSTIYMCDICETVFDIKYLYERHKKRKTTCLQHYIKISDDKYQCKFCFKEYTRSNAVNLHIETCYEKLKIDKDNEIYKLKELLEEKEEKINILTIKNQKLEIEFNSFKKKKKISTHQHIIQTPTLVQPITHTNNTTNTTTTTTNSNNIMENSNNTTNNNTIIVNFGNESITKLSVKDKKEILMECMLSISKCAEKVHFNDNIPNQQNTYLTSLKAQHGFKYVDGDFIATDLDELVEEILEKRKEDVREILENRKDIRISKFTIDKIYDLLNQLDNGNEEKIQRIKTEIKYVLYNNRNKVIK